MKALIEIIKEDPAEAVGGILTWSGLFFMAFMGFVIL